jgi:tripartite-type tricarboxylate transporter receptor subunit TctC
MLLAGAAFAQDWPARPVRVVVPAAAGGPADTAARIVSEELGRQRQQRFVVDNRTGAGNVVGTEIVARAAPDGHTMLFTTSGHAYTRVLYPKLPYDSVKDFRPVALVAQVPHVLIANVQLPVRTLREAIDLIRANPGKFNYGSAGNGSAIHFYFEYFLATAGNLRVSHVPYRGSAPALIDLMNGTLSFMTDVSSSALPYIRDGRVRAIAISSRARAKALPEVPTFGESGLPGYEVNGWYMVLMPAATSPRVVDQANAAIRQALGAAAVTERFEKLNLNVVGETTPASTLKHLNDEITRWTAVARRAGIIAEP